MSNRMNVRCILATSAAITFSLLCCGSAVAQASWSLKDQSNFSQPASKPLAPLPKSVAQPSNQFVTPGVSNASRRPSPPMNRSTSSRTRSRATTASSQSSDSTVYIGTCAVKYIDDVELPAQESGVLKSMLMKEGQSFKKGQGIAQIDDQLYREMLKQAQMKQNIASQRANDSTSIRAGKYKVKLAAVEAEKAQKLLAKGSKSESEYRRARYSHKVAVEELIAAENERDMAGLEAQLEQAKVGEVKTRIRRHAIRTNFDGYVLEKFRDAGEWVQAGEKVVRVGRMDRLYVQGSLDTTKLNPSEVQNQPVTVTLNLARGEKTTFEGRIVNVGLEKQGGGDLVIVKAEVNNRFENGSWTLRPGGSVEMEIRLNEPGVAATAAGATTR